MASERSALTKSLRRIIALESEVVSSSQRLLSLERLLMDQLAATERELQARVKFVMIVHLVNMRSNYSTSG